MPILPEEPCLFPENLLDPLTGPTRVPDAATERVWWVIYTKARQEKSLARQLEGSQVPFYMPMIPKDR